LDEVIKYVKFKFSCLDKPISFLEEENTWRFWWKI